MAHSSTWHTQHINPPILDITHVQKSVVARVCHLQELVVDEFGNSEAFLGVFRKTAQDEVLYLQGGWLAPGKVDVVVNNLAQVFLRPDLEGHLAVEELVGKHADVPDVHLVVVLLFLHHFWRAVQRCPT